MWLSETLQWPIKLVWANLAGDPYFLIREKKISLVGWSWSRSRRIWFHLLLLLIFLPGGVKASRQETHGGGVKTCAVRCFLPPLYDAAGLDAPHSDPPPPTTTSDPSWHPHALDIFPLPQVPAIGICSSVWRAEGLIYQVCNGRTTCEGRRQSSPQLLHNLLACCTVVWYVV